MQGKIYMTQYQCGVCRSYAIMNMKCRVYGVGGICMVVIQCEMHDKHDDGLIEYI